MDFKDKKKLRDELDKKFRGPHARLVDYVPGNWNYGSEETFYLEVDPTRGDYFEQISEVVQLTLEMPVKSGALNGSICRILLPTGENFHSANFWGDKAGWQARLESGAKASGKRLGKVEGENFCIDDGKIVLLKDCKIYFDLSPSKKERRVFEWSVAEDDVM